MPNPIPKRRLAAHKHQQGRCYYCGLPMWLKDPQKFAKQYGLKPSTVAGLRCTAEHLVAQQEGGTNAANNIVAACLTCNARRHRKKVPLRPPQHRDRVRSRLLVGKWHPRALVKLVSCPGRLSRASVPTSRTPHDRDPHVTPTAG